MDAELAELVLPDTPNESKILPNESSSAINESPKSSSPNPPNLEVSIFAEVGVACCLAAEEGVASCLTVEEVDAVRCWAAVVGVALCRGAVAVVTGGGLVLAVKELNTKSLSAPGDFRDARSGVTEEKEKRVSLFWRVPVSSEDTELEWSLPERVRPVGGRVRPPGG